MGSSNNGNPSICAVWVWPSAFRLIDNHWLCTALCGCVLLCCATEHSRAAVFCCIVPKGGAAECNQALLLRAAGVVCAKREKGAGKWVPHPATALLLPRGGLRTTERLN